MPALARPHASCALGAASARPIAAPLPARSSHRPSLALRHAARQRCTAPARQCTVARATSTAASASGGGGDAAAPSLLQRLGAFVQANFIPCGLIVAIVAGWTFPAPGVAAAGANMGVAATIGIFIISGLLLQRGESLAAVRSTTALAYGLTAILAVTPLAAFAMLRVPLQPPQMALGLAVFACMPTTLSANVTLTSAANGNTAVALLLTLVSNMLGVFTIPLLLSWVIGSGAVAGVAAFDAAQLFKNLVITVLLPLLGGAAVQAAVPGAQHWKRDHKAFLQYLSAACLCTVPWMQVSKASAARLPLTAGSLLAAGAAALALHVTLLGANLAATSVLRFAPKQADGAQQAQQDLAIRKAVVLSSTMKTLPVAVAVLTQLSGVLGASVGFAVIPCILAHLIQTIFASAVVSRWNARETAGLPAIG